MTIYTPNGGEAQNVYVVGSNQDPATSQWVALTDESGVPIDAANPLPVSDAALTDGSQISQVNSGSKGGSSSTAVTSTANGSDHQGLDVVEQFKPVYEDNVLGRALVAPKYSFLNITDQASHNAIKTGAGILGKIVINKATASGVLAVYDGLTSGGTLIATITMPAALLVSQVVLTYDVAFATGLTVVSSGANMDSTILYV